MCGRPEAVALRCGQAQVTAERSEVVSRVSGSRFMFVRRLTGPFEPSKEELDEFLEPVIENITKLYEGKFVFPTSSCI
jgi:hypothetical protein